MFQINKTFSSSTLLIRFPFLPSTAMVVVVVGFCFSREASVWFSAVLKCFNFHIFLKILGFFFLLLCNSHTIRRGMGVETRAQKPSHKVQQKFPERSWLANAVKILVIMMWVRLQTTKCITKFSDLLLSGFCVSLVFCFYILLVRLSFFTDASFFSCFVLYIDNDSFVRFFLGCFIFLLRRHTLFLMVFITISPNGKRKRVRILLV